MTGSDQVAVIVLAQVTLVVTTPIIALVSHLPGGYSLPSQEAMFSSTVSVVPQQCLSVVSLTATPKWLGPAWACAPSASDASAVSKIALEQESVIGDTAEPMAVFHSDVKYAILFFLMVSLDVKRRARKAARRAQYVKHLED